MTASASNFDFLAAPEIELNIIYRVDKVTGEVGACQYGDKEGTIGVTLCYPSGQGAKAQTPSAYTLVASRHEREAEDGIQHRLAAADLDGTVGLGQKAERGFVKDRQRRREA